MDWIFNFPKIAIVIFYSPLFRFWILITKIIAGIFSLVFIVGIIYYFRNSSYLKVKYFQQISDFMRRSAGAPAAKIIRRWKDISRNAESSEESNWKLAVLDADSILNTVLKGMGYRGETVEEKLIQIQPIHIQNIEELKKAHEMRDKIARDPNFRLTKDKTKEIIDVYRKTFEDLELI